MALFVARGRCFVGPSRQTVPQTRSKKRTGAAILRLVATALLGFCTPVPANAEHVLASVRQFPNS